MSLQIIIDKAQSIEIDRRKIVGQTVSRSERIRVAQRDSANAIKLKVQPPARFFYDQFRSTIEAIQSADRFTETEINLANNRNNFITEYQGELAASQLQSMSISTFTNQTVTFSNLPALGSTLTSRTQVITAQSFSAATSALYNRALSVTRLDFLITNSEYQANYPKIRIGDSLSTSTYITGGQTISDITYNYATFNGVGYTRILMSSSATQSSLAATVDGGDNINITVSNSTTVTNSTVIFKAGDWIQPTNSRYPYIVSTAMTRGSASTSSTTVHRPLITSEQTTVTGAFLVGTATTLRVVVTDLPLIQIVNRNQAQFSGDFTLVEKII